MNFHGQTSSSHLPPISARSTPSRDIRIDDIQIKTLENRDKQTLFELQEHVKILQEDNRKKDELIQKLSSMEVRGLNNSLANAAIGSGIANQSARGEIAALQVKLDSLHNRLREKEMEVENKSESINLLKLEMERLREDNARQSSQILSFTKQLEEYEDSQGTFDVLRTRNEIAVKTLQKQHKDAQEKVAELEAALRFARDQQEGAQSEKETIFRKHEQLIQEICNIFGLTTTNVEIRGISAKISALLEENLALKNQVNSLKSSFEADEKEKKASRETIMRLVSEVSREQKEKDSSAQSNQSLRQEISNLEMKTHQQEAKLAELHHQHEIKMAELHHQQEAKLAELHQQHVGKIAEIHQQQESKMAELHRQIDSLKKEKGHGGAGGGGGGAGAPFISEGYAGHVETDHFKYAQVHELPPQQQNILISRISEIVLPGEPVQSVQHLLETIEELQAQLDASSMRVSELEEQGQEKPKETLVITRLSRKSTKKPQLSSFDKSKQDSHLMILDFKERTKALQAEMAAMEIIVDSLKSDKEKFFKYMQRLAEIMRMDRINFDIGFDMIGEALVARAEQLCHGEADANADRNLTMYNLKRKLKQMKEQLESKDLHLDLLRKKICNLEERLHGKTDIEKERDMESLQVRKLVKQLEKTQTIVEQLREENVHLKAQLLEFSNFKITALEQGKKMEQMKQKLSSLNQNNADSTKKIKSLEELLSKKEKQWNESSKITDGSVQSLAAELKLVKEQNDDSRRKEKQLVEFRAVIGRLLGLEIDMLAIPDYEIINRLERLIQAHQSNVYTAFTMEKALGGLDHHYRQVGEGSQLFAVGYRDPLIPPMPTISQRHTEHHQHHQQHHPQQHHHHHPQNSHESS